MWNWLKALFKSKGKSKSVDEVHYTRKGKEVPKNHPLASRVRFPKPLQYIKQHGTPYQYNMAKRYASAGNGEAVRRIAGQVYEEKP